jgi:hypothetical protein
MHDGNNMPSHTETSLANLQINNQVHTSTTANIKSDMWACLSGTHVRAYAMQHSTQWFLIKSSRYVLIFRRWRKAVACMDAARMIHIGSLAGRLAARTWCITHSKQGVGRNIERHAEAHVAGTLQSNTSNSATTVPQRTLKTSGTQCAIPTACPKALMCSSTLYKAASLGARGHSAWCMQLSRNNEFCGTGWLEMHE